MSGAAPAMLRRSIPAVLMLLLAAGISQAMVPRHAITLKSDAFSLEDVIPKQIAGWQAEPRIRLVDKDEPDSLANKIYSQTVARAYRNDEGDIIMLLAAYGPSQSKDLQLHRPELCYAASGFKVSAAVRETMMWHDNAPPLHVVRLMSRRESRIEPITYWMRIGGQIATSNLQQQAIRVRYGLRGEIPDGMLVRVSSVSGDPDRAYELQDQFLRELFAEIDPQNLKLFVGSLADQETAVRGQGAR